MSCLLASSVVETVQHLGQIVPATDAGINNGGSSVVSFGVASGDVAVVCDAVRVQLLGVTEHLQLVQVILTATEVCSSESTNASYTT